jgi:hypothetical protein
MVKSFALFMPPRIRVGELISPFLGASVRNVFDSRRGDIGSPSTMVSQWKVLRSLHWLHMGIGGRIPPLLGWALALGNKEGRYRIALDHGRTMGSASLASLADHGHGGPIPPLHGARVIWGVFSRVPVFGPAPFAIGCHAVGVLVELAAE